MTSTSALTIVVALMIGLGGSIGWAAPTDDALGARDTPGAKHAPATSAEEAYGSGLQARASRDWTAAVASFHGAVQLRRSFPEAWNELGYALRQQGRYEEALTAYDEALRLRPSFPEAMEYLGEAYVKLGRLSEARDLLARLEGLSPEHARDLAEAIERGK